MGCELAVALAFFGFASSTLDSASEHQNDGRYAQAMQAYQAVEPCVRAMGPSFTVEARWENNVASLLFRQGDLIGAEQHYARALPLWGPAQEQDKARTMANLAGLESMRGNAEHARGLLEQAAEIQRRHDGDGLTTTLTMLSTTLTALGDREGARRALEEARAIIKSKPHAVDDAVAFELAACSQAQGSRDFVAAEKSCHNAEQIARRFYAAQDARYAHVRLRQGQLAFVQQHYDEAADHLLVAARRFADTSPQGLFHGRALFQLALVRRAQWQVPTALGLLERARPALEANLPPTDPERIQLICVKADLLRQNGRKDEAETLARQAVEMAESNGKRADLASEALNTLGVVLYERKTKLDESSASFEKAITLRESIDGSGSLPTSQLLQNLAQVRLAQRRYADAAHLAESVCNIRKTYRGADDPSLAAPLAIWAKALTATGDKRTARDLQRRAEQLHRRDPSTAAAQSIFSLHDQTQN